MWTQEHRARQAAFERRRRYPTDLTNEEWVACRIPRNQQVHGAAKRNRGRKRHVAVDTDGYPLMVNLTTPDIQTATIAEPANS